MNTVAQFVPPKRQSILLAQRELREQQQDREVKEATKKAREVQRTQKQRDIPVNLFVKACGSIGNAFWTLAISLVLTLLASYLVANPQYLAMLAQPVEQFFSVSLAGASPPSGETRQRDREAEIKVEREFGAEYIGKERQIIEALGQFRRHSVGKYSGSLPLTKLELTPVVGPLIEKVDRTVEFDQLPTNDVLQLPMGQNFTLRSDKKLGAKAEHSLRAAEWKWEVQERDDFGLPRLYKALVTYRGEERWLDYKSLRVVAHYTGYISREDASDEPAVPEISDNARPNIERPQSNQAPTRVASQSATATVEEPEIIMNEPIVENASVETGLDDEAAESAATRSADEESDGNLLLPLVAGLGAAATAGSAAAVIFYRRRKREQAD